MGPDDNPWKDGTILIKKMIEKYARRISRSRPENMEGLTVFIDTNPAFSVISFLDYFIFFIFLAQAGVYRACHCSFGPSYHSTQFRFSFKWLISHKSSTWNYSGRWILTQELTILLIFSQKVFVFSTWSDSRFVQMTSRGLQLMPCLPTSMGISSIPATKMSASGSSQQGRHQKSHSRFPGSRGRQFFPSALTRRNFNFPRSIWWSTTGCQSISSG